MRIFRRPSKPAFVFLMPLLALAGVAAGCGGSTKAATSSTTSTTVARGGATARAQFTQCLESHGVPASVATSFGTFRRNGNGGGGGGTSTTTTPDVSTPTSTPGSRPTVPSQYSAAFTSCRSLLPAGPGGGGGGFLNNPADAAYRNCLQVHGVTLPTAPSGTTPGSAPAGGGAGGGFANDPNFQAARQACASLLPASTTPTTTSTGSGS